MPGPFPGMDPYLEDSQSWQGTHNTLIAFLSSELNRLLPEPYVSEVEARCYIGRLPDMQVRPDIILKRKPLSPLPINRSNTAVAEQSDRALLFHVYPLEEREAFINILTVRGDRHIVTTIELLSPTNKTLRNEGRRLYREKQEQILASQVHLIEMDLLRSGEHAAAVPQEVFLPEHQHDYLICLHRAGAGGTYQVWLNTLRDRLPRIEVPLEEGFPDVILDLQAVLDRTYEEGAYRRKIDYSLPPVPPLEEAEAIWADALLREKGPRS